ncbi:hypothetical protein F511_01885 [Dorcoceras hygrometricum]|uniref:HMA domain-containing protein n=1 Tax=Dorcoceras hygrometricum TaxID=472368 RepID=A0A2Z7CWB4_9LAMI|nr:hypothetical protein F511_01885 [Dorcoceras hygrometricum]
MRVHMDCPGCERRVKKAISKLDGVENIDIDMDMQKVTVTGWADVKKVLKAARRSGRNAELWPFPYNPEYNGYSHHYDYYGSQANSLITEDFLAEPSSTYNYYEHGYNGHNHGYYKQPPYSTILDDRASTIFSDENATGCSIM